MLMEYTVIRFFACFLPPRKFVTAQLFDSPVCPAQLDLEGIGRFCAASQCFLELSTEPVCNYELHFSSRPLLGQ
jgi:hypothetical protein